MYLRKYNELDFGFINEEIGDILETDIFISKEDYIEFCELQRNGRYMPCRLKSEAIGEGLFDMIEEFTREQETPKAPSIEDKVKQLEEETLTLKLAMAEIVESISKN